MTLEVQIAALLEEAAPLRCLVDDDPAKIPLCRIVDKINALRAIQAGPGYSRPIVVEADPVVSEEGADADGPELPKRRPGRPRKAE